MEEESSEKSANCQPQNETIPSYELIWENDSENPKNWPLWYKSFIMVTVAFISTVV